jgi:hypothetical protein
VRGPYGFELTDSCPTCKFRRKGFFCQLSLVELKDFDAVKFVSAIQLTQFFLRNSRGQGESTCSARVR